MPEPDFVQLNRLIAEQGAHWVAGPTTHSAFVGAPDIAGLLGVAATPEMIQQAQDEAAGFDAALAHIRLVLPARIDWRNHNGRRWVTPVRDQGTCGTCVAFAVNACLESRLMIAQNLSTKSTPDLSEAHLFFCGGNNTCTGGWWPPNAFSFASKPGVGAEANFPYATHQGVCKPIKPVVKAVTYRSTRAIIGRKLALQTGPVVGCMSLRDDFLTYQSGVYQPVTGLVRSIHAVCIVGYDDVDQCWIGRNSWGSGWGLAGYFKIKYGTCGLDTTNPFFYSGAVSV